MARKNKHHNLKPKVSIGTYIILGAIFIVLTIAIILSIDTEKKRFNKEFDLGNHNYQVSTLKKVEKAVKKGENVLVVFRVESAEAGLPDATLLLNETQSFYNNEEGYYYLENDLSERVDKIYYVKVVLKDNEALSDFLVEYGVAYYNQLMLLYFEGDKLMGELNLNATHETTVERRNLVENLNVMYRNIQTRLEEQ